MEQHRGLEPLPSVWKTEVLPLHQCCIWRSVEDSNLCDVAAGLGLAIRPLTCSGNAPYDALQPTRRAVTPLRLPLVAGCNAQFSRVTFPDGRRLKDLNPQRSYPNGFLDRSATNYGISRRIVSYDGICPRTRYRLPAS